MFEIEARMILRRKETDTRVPMTGHWMIVALWLRFPETFVPATWLTPDLRR